MGATAEPADRAGRSILTATRRCPSLSAWFEATLDQVDARLGFERSSLLIVLKADRRSVPRAFAGTAHGQNADVLREYFERWADSDPLATERAHQIFDRDGIATLVELYPELGPPQRRFVDEFLRSVGIADQLSMRLPGNGTTDGYLTIHASNRIGSAQRGELKRLGPGLANQLRAFLPKGLPGPLALRERHAAELAAFGFSNREIAAVMKISEDTVKKHLFRAMTKLGVRHRTELAVSWTTGRRLAPPLAVRQQRPTHPQPSAPR